MLLSGTAGPVVAPDGTSLATGVRLGRLGETIVSELHGRFYEQVFRGNVYSIGCSATALSANTITLTNTSTPILGVWNPSGAAVNLVMLQCSLQAYPNTLTTPVGPGTFVWASSLNNSAITTGSAPINRKTLATGASLTKAFPGGVALTGLTNNTVIFEGADFSTIGPVTYSTLTAVQTNLSSGGVQNFDGGLVVPPGGVLALLNTTSTTTVTVSGRLMWEEVPIS